MCFYVFCFWYMSECFFVIASFRVLSLHAKCAALVLGLVFLHSFDVPVVHVQKNICGP